MFGPTGAGVLYGKRALLESLPPYQGGGDMIASVTFEKTTYNVLPHRFEAGTPDIAAVVGLGAAIDYLNHVGLGCHRQPRSANWSPTPSSASRRVRGVTLIGTPEASRGVVSFTIDGIHPHDAGMILDHEGIAIRAGHHCTQPVMDFFGVPATNRASFAFYNTRARRGPPGRGHRQGQGGVQGIAMSDMRELYQEMILDHHRHPRNFGKLADANRHAEGFNPLCGDRVTVYALSRGRRHSRRVVRGQPAARSAWPAARS